MQVNGPVRRRRAGAFASGIKPLNKVATDLHVHSSGGAREQCLVHRWARRDSGRGASLYSQGIVGEPCLALEMH